MKLLEKLKKNKAGLLPLLFLIVDEGYTILPDSIENYVRVVSYIALILIIILG
jgi:hypothetical protein